MRYLGAQHEKGPASHTQMVTATENSGFFSSVSLAPGSAELSKLLCPWSVAWQKPLENYNYRDNIELDL